MSSATQPPGRRSSTTPAARFDRELLKKTESGSGSRTGRCVHPSAMFRLFAALWRKRRRSSWSSRSPVPAAHAPPSHRAASRPAGGLRRREVLFQQGVSRTRRRTGRSCADTIRAVSRQVPVALLSTRCASTSIATTSAASGSGRVRRRCARDAAQESRACRRELIAGARGFIGTYGGFSYLAPFYGVPSLSFFSRRDGFEPHHLDLAHRVFDRLLPGGFLASTAASDRRGRLECWWIRRSSRVNRRSDRWLHS